MNDEELVNFLRIGIKALDQAKHPYQVRRYAGMIEGALIVGKIKSVGDDFEYNYVIEENPNIFAPWFPGTKKTIVRKERYEELMQRWAVEYIESLEDVSQ